MTWLTVAEVRGHCQISAARDVDEQLFLFIRAAEQWLDRTIGKVRPPAAAVEELHDGGDRTIVLDEPVAALVVAVTVNGSAVAERTDMSHGWYAKPIDLAGGLVRHSSRFPYGTVKVAYYPGRATTEADIHLAALELVKHLWEVSQNGDGSSAAINGLLGADGGTQQTPRGFAIPKRVRELLKLGNRETAQVLVG